MTLEEIIRTEPASHNSTSPVELILTLMKDPQCHMHGPEHHYMVASCLLIAYKNAGGDIDLQTALAEAYARGSKVPGGVCGNWGSCGAAISTGIFISVITGASPVSGESWGLSNLMTSESLKNIGSIGGPRCCKRNSVTAIKTAIKYVEEHFGIHMTDSEYICGFSADNAQCIGSRCPYNANKEITE